MLPAVQRPRCRAGAARVPRVRPSPRTPAAAAPVLLPTAIKPSPAALLPLPAAPRSPICLGATVFTSMQLICGGGERGQAAIVSNKQLFRLDLSVREPFLAA